MGMLEVLCSWRLTYINARVRNKIDCRARNVREPVQHANLHDLAGYRYRIGDRPKMLGLAHSYCRTASCY